MPLILAVAGCTTPKALTDSELARSSSDYWKSLGQQVKQASAPVSLDRAVAIAIQNNLEFRVHALEAAIATGNRQLATINMLPSLTYQAGYRQRSNVLASSSMSVLTGTVSLVPSTSSEDKGHTDALAFGWNVLDFGLQYYRAKEYGQQTLIAEEERRKAVQAITRDVVYYWWMAKGYDEIQPDIEATRGELEDALRNANALAKQRLNNPADFLEYNKALYLIMKRMDRLVLEMNQARNELARLMGLPAGMPLRLADSLAPLDGVVFPDASLRQWQTAALMYRPEMRQAQYHSRIAEIQSDSFWLGLLPGLQLGYGGYRDSNSFLVNNNWSEYSTQLSWNLMKLATIPSARKLQKLSKELAEDQVRLQATAVLSQVAVAMNAVRYSDHSSCVSRNLADVDNQRLGIMNARAGAAVLDHLSLIRAKVDNLLLRAEQVTDRADEQRARATLLASVGVGIAPESFESGDVDVVAQDLRNWWQTGLTTHMQDVMEKAKSALPRSARDETSISLANAKESELCL